MLKSVCGHVSTDRSPAQASDPVTEEVRVASSSGEEREMMMVLKPTGYIELCVRALTCAGALTLHMHSRILED